MKIINYKSANAIMIIITVLVLMVLIFSLFFDGNSSGNNWIKLYSPVDDDLHDIFFIDNEIGWIYSYGTGVIMKTTDGGSNWEVISILDKIYFEQIQFLDRNIGWICGDWGKIYKTEDGGETWIDQSIQSSSSRIMFYAMFFFCKRIGFVAGMCMESNKRVEYVFYKTTNGGETWIKQKNTPQTMLYNFFFLNDKVGYASGNNSIYKTIDNGKNWNIVYQGDFLSKKDQIRGLFFINEKNG